MRNQVHVSAHISHQTEECSVRLTYQLSGNLENRNTKLYRILKSGDNFEILTKKGVQTNIDPMALRKTGSSTQERTFELGNITGLSYKTIVLDLESIVINKTEVEVGRKHNHILKIYVG